MHPIELERKLRLPDPAKTVESIWKLLKKTRQRLDTSTTTYGAMRGSSPELVAAERKKARIEADRRKSQGVYYTQWRHIR